MNVTKRRLFAVSSIDLNFRKEERKIVENHFVSPNYVKIEIK